MPASKTSNPAPESDAWIPENPGDQITGQIIDVDQAWSDVSDTFYPLLRIDTDDGIRTVHGFRTVLRNEIIKRRPIPGERITITFQGVSGKEPRKGQSAPWIFVVQVHRSEEAHRMAADRMYDSLGGAPGSGNVPVTPDTPQDLGDIPF